MSTISPLLLVLIGLVSGIAAGLFGIGGGVLIVPALIYLAKFEPHLAIGTSLAVLLPPVGLGAVIEYYRQGGVDIKAALVIALALLVGGWIGAHLAGIINGHVLKLCFGIFVTGIGFYLMIDALHAIGS